MIRRASVSRALLGGLLLGLLHCSRAQEKATSDPQVTPYTPSSSQPAGLSGTSWRLVRFKGGDGTILEPDDRDKYTIAFRTDGRLSARISCNRGMGTWKSTRTPQLEFGPLALTRAYCLPEPIYDHLVKQWENVRSYVIKNGHLYVSLMADGGIYEYEPMQPEENPDRTMRRKAATPGRGTLALENTYWKLTELGGAPVGSSQVEPHLLLDRTTRRVTGSAGCNQFSGGYQVDGDRLRLSQTVSTMMACTRGMDTEKAFLRALGQVNGWEITEQQLELLDSSGNVLARFEGRRAFE
jgi:heat shock protein HslJ